MPDLFTPSVVGSDGFDPFLEHANPIGVPRSTETDEYGSIRGADPLQAKAKRKAQPTHIPMAMALLEQMHPGCLLYVSEKKVTTFSGAVVKVDQWGFADLVGITAKGGWVAANVTTTAAMGAHMRDYTNPANCHGAGQRRVVDILERYLALRGAMYIIGYEQEGRFWIATTWTVTQELINEYKARKRG